MLEGLTPAIDAARHRQDRLDAVRRLVVSGGADASAVLVGALALPDAEFQSVFFDDMVAAVAPALAALKIAAGHRCPIVRRNAIALLARFPEETSTDLLIERLSDSDSTVRLVAAEIAGRLNDRRVIAGLTAMARDDSDWNCSQAAEAILHQIGTRLLAPHQKRLISEKPDERNEARKAVVSEGSVVVVPLAEMLEHGNPTIRCAVADVLGEIGDARAVGVLLRTMNDPDEDVRSAVTQALSRMKSENVARALIANLTNPDDKLAADTALAILSQGSSAVPPLIEVLNSSRRELRSIAVELLSRIRDRRATEPLVACLASSDSWLRAAAARGLGRLGDSDATDSLIGRLHDATPLVRAAAADALGELRVTRASEPLVAALHDEELIVEIAAARALGRIGDESAISPLIRILGTDNLSLKVAVIDALADSRDSRAIGAMKRLLAPWPLGNEPAEVKAAARKALEVLQPRI